LFLPFLSLSLPPSSLSPTFPLPRTYSSLLPLILIEEKRKKMAVLLVYNKGSHTGSFLVIVPCIYVL
jgi:hypothetical protein